jgi:hypothetical protein
MAPFPGIEIVVSRTRLAEVTGEGAEQTLSVRTVASPQL